MMKKPARAKTRKAAPPKKRASTTAVTFVDLGPSAPPALAVAGKSLQWTALTVGPRGALPVAPTRLVAATGDWVVWVVTNESARALTLSLKDFKRRSDGKALKPIQWIQPRLALGPRGVGVIVGRIAYSVKDPKAGGEMFRYTIEVRGPGAIDYDPDLEIRPPA
jgi:hypothetical protein